VTVIDLEPPELLCHEDKFASPGSAWMFDIPSALDIYDGTNVLLQAVATVTNSLTPGAPALFSVTRTWRTTDTCGNASFCNQTVTVVPVAVSPPRLTNLTWLGNGGFRFGFTNASGASFTILGTNNLALAASNWPVVGTAWEIAPGQYQFTDTTATNSVRRFYEIRSP
jgi:hypothetical protein